MLQYAILHSALVLFMKNAMWTCQNAPVTLHKKLTTDTGTFFTNMYTFFLYKQTEIV